MTPSSSGPALSVRGLRVSYAVRGGRASALWDVGFEIGHGECYGLVGESGCGKSTVAMAVVRHLPPGGQVEAGEIRLDGTDVLRLEPRELRAYRGRQVAMVYQDPGTALNPSLSVGRQIAEVYQYQEKMSRKAAAAASLDMLARVLLRPPRQFAGRYPHQLSGGQQQRVVIAMALAARPRLLVLDEPTTNLDATVEAEVLSLVMELRREFVDAVLFITHNLALVNRMCDRVGVLYAGRVVEDGVASEVLRAPCHPYTGALLRCVPRVTVSGEITPLSAIPGSLPRIGQVLPGCSFQPRCHAARAECATAEPPLEPPRPVASPLPASPASGAAGAEAGGAGVGPEARSAGAAPEAGSAGAAPEAGSGGVGPEAGGAGVGPEEAGSAGVGPRGEGSGVGPKPAVGGLGGGAGGVNAGGAADGARSAAGASSPRLVRCYFPGSVPPPAEARPPRELSRVGEPLLEISALTKRYGSVEACGEVSLSVGAGEVVGLVGESGSGKTTLGRCIVGLSVPDSGEVAFRGTPLAKSLGRRSLEDVKRLQMVLQSPDSTLNPRHKVRRILRRAARRLGGRSNADELGAMVRLDGHHLDQRASELSGGLRQRVGIARAFAGDPALVVCDEPVSSLDVSVQAAILELLLRLQADNATAYLFISHDLAVVRYLSHRIAVMYRGQIVEVGKAAEVFSPPHHPYTELLLSAIPTLDAPPGWQGMSGVTVEEETEAEAACRFFGRCPYRIPGLCDIEPPPLVDSGGGHMLRCHRPASELVALQLRSGPQEVDRPAPPSSSASPSPAPLGSAPAG